MSGVDASAVPAAVVFDVGMVLYRWDLRLLFGQLIEDESELDWFCANVVTPEWHFQHDAGRPLDEMVPELQARHPDHAHVIEAYRTRFNETIPGPVEGTHAIVRRLTGAGVPVYGLTNFGAEFWDGFRPGQDIFDGFRDIVVSGREKVAKPDPEIYAIAERRFGHPPGELFFIDDRADNIAAAKARGWHGHLFTDSRTLEVALRNAGLLP
ncbi:HAD family hydrolase [Aurantiacibacter spongiae]|uniref:HAD family phosphatase n=1 Tax=Aurantiacibacter spongiae TaxID=2488860 RepID=A0A3N5DRK1_9SPHN|nr:HAD family phosphatase [Aurantiacibacter spongiae]RPF71811.1 HAD family phosphatase [Aurantiacibacter spongiae]